MSNSSTMPAAWGWGRRGRGRNESLSLKSAFLCAYVFTEVGVCKYLQNIGCMCMWRGFKLGVRHAKPDPSFCFSCDKCHIFQ